MKKFNWPTTEKNFFNNSKNEWKLETMYEALHFLENPHKILEGKVIHIAGTNGKGSTASYIKTILEEAGYKVGCFTSPHLVEYNERFYFNKRFATDDEINKCKQEIIAKCDNVKEISYFEVSTLIAILLFSRAKLDYFIFEVGLGGRLDATNIFQNPLACVITSISFDHMEILGNTLKKIAYEKGGIIKKNSHVFTSNTNQEVVDVLQKIADTQNAILKIQERDYKVNLNLQPSLFGQHQIINANLASEVCKYIGINKKIIETGVKKTKWDGRLQEINLLNIDNKECSIDNIYLDGAHNEDGIRCLCDFVNQKKSLYQKNVNIIGVFAVLKRKDYKSFFSFLQIFDKLCFYNVPKEINDFVVPEELKNIANTYNIDNCIINNFIEIKQYLIKDKKNIIFIFGSLYFVGFVLENFVVSKAN